MLLHIFILISPKPDGVLYVIGNDTTRTTGVLRVGKFTRKAKHAKREGKSILRDVVFAKRTEPSIWREGLPEADLEDNWWSTWNFQSEFSFSLS